MPPTFNSNTFADQAVIRPVVPLVEGVPSVGRTLAIRVSQFQDATVEWIVRDQSGLPVNLVGFTSGSSETSSDSSNTCPVAESTGTVSETPADGTIKIRLREALALQGWEFWEATGSVYGTGEAGTVRFNLPAPAVALPGILQAEVALFFDSRLLISNCFYVIVDRGSMGVDYNYQGCPTVAELRTFLRDSGPEDNYLLATLEYELGEIAASMVRCVNTWNTVQPPIQQRFTTTTFRWPTGLIPGIIGYLYTIASANYLRNALAYSAAGLSIDDKNKFQQYEEKGKGLIAEFERWLKAKKIQYNADAFNGSIGSPYERGGRYR